MYPLYCNLVKIFGTKVNDSRAQLILTIQETHGNPGGNPWKSEIPVFGDRLPDCLLPK